jgi:dephospho-CoA kinase
MKGMTYHPNLKILALVGLPGAGKSTAVDHFTEKGYPKVYFGGVVLDAMRHAGIELTPDNEKNFREELRAKEGKDFIVNRILEQITRLAESGQHRIVADGLYTWTEYKILKHAFPGELSVVAVVTPKHLRYQRLAHRPIRPLTPEEAQKRDWSEIENLEKGGPIAIADYYIANNDDIEHFYTQLDEIKTAIEF